MIVDLSGSVIESMYRYSDKRFSRISTIRSYTGQAGKTVISLIAVIIKEII